MERSSECWEKEFRVLGGEVLSVGRSSDHGEEFREENLRVLGGAWS